MGFTSPPLLCTKMKQKLCETLENGGKWQQKQYLDRECSAQHPLTSPNIQQIPLSCREIKVFHGFKQSLYYLLTKNDFYTTNYKTKHSITHFYLAKKCNFLFFRYSSKIRVLHVYYNIKLKVDQSRTSISSEGGRVVY